MSSSSLYYFILYTSKRQKLWLLFWISLILSRIRSVKIKDSVEQITFDLSQNLFNIFYLDLNLRHKFNYKVQEMEYWRNRNSQQKLPNKV